MSWPAPMAHSYRLRLVTWMFESRSGRIFVIVVVHIQCSKLFKCLEFTVLPIVLCAIKSLDVNRNKSRTYSGFVLPSVAILSRLCRKRRKAIFTHSQSVHSVSLRDTFTWSNYLLKSQKILVAPALKRLTLCMYGSRS